MKINETCKDIWIVLHPVRSNISSIGSFSSISFVWIDELIFVFVDTQKKKWLPASTRDFGWFWNLAKIASTRKRHTTSRLTIDISIVYSQFSRVLAIFATTRLTDCFFDISKSSMVSLTDCCSNFDPLSFPLPPILI